MAANRDTLIERARTVLAEYEADPMAVIAPMGTMGVIRELLTALELAEPSASAPAVRVPRREAFEKWILSRPYPNPKIILARRDASSERAGEYVYVEPEWIAWQAALAAVGEAREAAPEPVDEAAIDAEVARIMEMSDDEIRASVVASGRDPDEVVRKMRAAIDNAMKRLAILDGERAMRGNMAAAPVAPGAEWQTVPTEKGVYAWRDGNSYALVLVGKRPSEHVPGGTLNGKVIESCKFYDGCAVGGAEPKWGKGTWTRLDAPQPPTQSAQGAEDRRDARIAELETAFRNLANKAIDAALAAGNPTGETK